MLGPCQDKIIGGQLTKKCYVAVLRIENSQINHTKHNPLQSLSSLDYFTNMRTNNNNLFLDIESTRKKIIQDIIIKVSRSWKKDIFSQSLLIYP